MNTINFSNNNINDILKRAKQIETEQTRQNLKKKPIAKHLEQLENTGVLDAIDYAPKRAWGDLFTHTPSFKYINSEFVTRRENPETPTNLETNFNQLKTVQSKKQWTKSIRNVTGTLAVGAGVAAATLTPLGQVAGLGYLAGWTMPTAVTAGLAGLTSVGAEIFNSHNFTNEGGFNKQEENALNAFTTQLKTYAQTRATDMHKYWSAADKVAKINMKEGERLKVLSRLYTEGNNKLREQHNVSLVDVYLTDEQKRDLKGYNQIEDGTFVATSLNKDMQELPPSIQDNFYTTKGENFTVPSEQDKPNLNAVIGFKLHALENIGVTVDKSKLKLAENHSVTNINEAINKYYGPALDDALLIYQGKHSMAAPIIEKVEKVLQGALEKFSTEVIKQAKAQGLKDVPQITENLVEKTLSFIMLQTSIPANDVKLTKILNAVANNTALKVAANLNNYASDTKKAAANKAVYKAASLDDLYDNDSMRTRGFIRRVISDSEKADLRKADAKALKDSLDKMPRHELKALAQKLSKETGKTIWAGKPYLFWGQRTLRKRRWNPIPNPMGKKLDLEKYPL